MGLLVVIAGYYLDAKKRNFMLMYLVVVSVTVLLDVIKIAAMPNLDTMTPGAAFGAVIYFFIFVLKFASFFDLWHTDNVVEAWAEFTQTDLLTAKKALYLLL